MKLSKLFFIICFCGVLNAAPLEPDLNFGVEDAAIFASGDSTDSSIKNVKTAFEKALEEYLKADNNLRILYWPTLSEDVLKGKFSRIDIRFKSGSVQGIEALNVEWGHISVKDLSFDFAELMTNNKLVVKSVGDLGFRVRVNEGDLNDFLVSSQRQLNLQTPKVELKDGKMYFIAKVKTLFFNSKVKTEGSFLVNKENQTVDFRASNTSLNSLPIPGFMINNLLNRINPILNLKQFALVEQINIELEDIKIQHGYIELSGS